jgi:hypothetical protein
MVAWTQIMGLSRPRDWTLKETQDRGFPSASRTAGLGTLANPASGDQDL